MSLKISWDKDTKQFKAIGRDPARLRANGDIKVFQAEAQRINSSVVASHNFSYAFIRDTLIMFINAFVKIPLAETFKDQIKFFYGIINPNGYRDSYIESFLRNIQIFLSSWDALKNEYDSALEVQAQRAIAMFINHMGADSNNLMWGYEKTNIKLEHRFDFPYGICLQAGYMTIRSCRGGIITNTRFYSTRIAQPYERLVSEIIESGYYVPQSMAFLVTNINGKDRVVSSQDLEIENELVQNNGVNLRQPSNDFKLCVWLRKKSAYKFFSRYDLANEPFSIVYM